VAAAAKVSTAGDSHLIPDRTAALRMPCSEVDRLIVALVRVMVSSPLLADEASGCLTPSKSAPNSVG